MKDCKGNKLSIGDRVYVCHPDLDFRGPGWVRAFSDRVTQARADDGIQNDSDLATNGYTWSAWVESADVEKI